MSKIDTIKRIMERAYNSFEPYIRYIRFPHYRQLFDGERIDFNFPLTVLVGPNGCNKSSVLQALYGCPDRNNTGYFWFSTDVDIINENDGRHCCIHGYWLDGEGEVESLKTRINKKVSPDYWEPSRPLVKHGMKPIPQNKGKMIKGRTETRWKAISKNVVYLDFRAEIGAYDKYFWHGDLHRTETIKSKQDYIRHKSKYLRTVINKNLKTYAYYSKDRIRKNILLSPEACKEVSKILGHEYDTVRLIEHSFYGGQFGKTVILNRADMEYSEAFAGSGETSVAVLVHAIMSAQDKSLILLDEPETSLHPKAQENLREFLLQQIISRKHQIVISTHSPTMVSNLPPEAIKVMYVNPIDHKVRIRPKSFPEEAFEAIGFADSNSLKIYVEDALAKVIIDVYLQKYRDQLRNSIEVNYIPGGADSIMKYSVNIASVRNEKTTFFIFDGDKYWRNRPTYDQEARDKLINYEEKNGTIDVINIPASENQLLARMVKELVGCDIHLYLDGNAVAGGNENQKYKQLKDFLDFWSENVFYLPGMQPEELLYSSLSDQDKTSIFGDPFSAEGVNWKEYFVIKTKKDLVKPNPTSEDILLIQRQLVAKFPENCEVFELVGNIIANHFAN